MFGVNRSAFSTLTVAASGALAFGDPTLIPVATPVCNGVIVSPFVDGNGNYIFTSAVVLRIQMKRGYSTPSNDLFLHVATVGGVTVIPLCCEVFAVALYAIVGDQTKNVSVNLF